MIQPNGQNGNRSAATIQDPPASETVLGTPAAGEALVPGPDLATTSKQRARQQFQQNRLVIIAAGAFVAALLIFVATSIPSKRSVPKPNNGMAATTHDAAAASSAMPSDKSLFPITDSGRPPAKETHEGFLNERDLQQTATGRPTSGTPRAAQGNADGTLASIPPFGEQSWQAPPYQPGASANNAAEISDSDKTEREAMNKSSLVYVRSTSALQGSTRGDEASTNPGLDIGLGLATGTRLRARLESAASSAVRTPVLAVIEYNYERDGVIVVPAGARVVGHMQDADLSGYVRIQFDSLMMPDGAAVPIQAVATDLEMRPLKGKVEGKNTGKNVLVRSLSGIGEVGAMLLGGGNLNQPLSESDLLRERIGSNIGEVGDEQVSRMGVTQHIVVTIPADIPIYVVLEQTPKSNAALVQSGLHSSQPGNSANAEELLQLLQLQRELNQSSTTMK
jgi:hypothetical protein